MKKLNILSILAVMVLLGAAIGVPYQAMAGPDDCEDDDDGCPKDDPKPVLMCGGLPATIIGTEGNDWIFGTAGNDVIVALGGRDRVDGRNGDDVICGGEGDDIQLAGSNGNDRVYGGPGDDFLLGGNGNDLLIGGGGKDKAFGNLGPVTIPGETDRCNAEIEKNCDADP